MQKTEIIQCFECGKDVIKLTSEIKRRKKNGKNKFYCNSSCASKHKTLHLKQYQNHFKEVKYVRHPDKYSDFRWYIKQIKKGSKKKELSSDIDLEYLSQLWLTQDGKCPITKQKLTLRTHHNYKIKKSPDMASLDRIDNNKGYIKGNVRFVSLMYNYAKNIYTDEDVVKFCQLVVENL